MGDDVITAATGIPMLTILRHGATTALLVPTRLSIQNTLVVYRFGVADRTTRPIIDSRETKGAQVRWDALSNEGQTRKIAE